MLRVIGAIGGTILVAVVAIWMVLAGRRDFDERLPSVFYRGVRVEYTEGAQEWEGLASAIDALYTTDTSQNAYVGRIILTVYPPGAEIDGPELNGTMTLEGPPLGPKSIFIKVRQLTNNGSVANACASAVHHEFVEHAVPGLRYGDTNGGHDRPELTAISLEMTAKCKTLLSQQPSAIFSPE